MNKTLKLVLFLAIISAISGLLIGSVNDLVEPKIEENALKAEESNLKLIFPNGDFEKIDFSDDTGVVTAVYKNDGGYVVKATATGYNSSTPIIVLVGFDNEGTIIAVQTLQQQETNGYGARVFETDNLNSLYIGKDINTTVDMLTGATYTSTAMKQIMSTAQGIVKGLIG